VDVIFAVARVWDFIVIIVIKEYEIGWIIRFIPWFVKGYRGSSCIVFNTIEAI